MGFLPDDILMRDDTFSLFWKDQADCLIDQDDTFPYPGPVTGILGDLSGKDLANTFFYDDSSYLPDPIPDPGATNGQTYNTTSILQAAEDHDQEGFIESGFSSLSGSSFSSPSFDTDNSSSANGFEWKHVGNDGIEWEHVEDVQLELNQDDLRRHSLDSLCVGTAPSADQESAKNNRSKSATQAELVKPRRRRGRKPSNLSPEEKRRRRLERGRLAANKCRRKKRELENELESRAKDLLAERNHMLKINSSLKDELQDLLEELMNHSNAACGGIPEATGLIGSCSHLETPSLQAMVDLEQSVANLYQSQACSSGLSSDPSRSPSLVLDTDPGSPSEMISMMLAGQTTFMNS